MKSLIDQDIVVSLHSDTPVGVPSPLLEVWVAVNRIGAIRARCTPRPSGSMSRAP